MLAALLFVASGCGHESDSSGSSSGSTTGAGAPGVKENAASEPSVDDLLALPYTGWVEQDGSGEDGLVFRDPQRSCPGYTLFSAFRQGKAVLVDDEGEVVHTWQAPNAWFWVRVKLLANGDILTTGADKRAPSDTPDSERYALRMSWDGTIIWKKQFRAHHDIATTPDGRLLTLTFSRRLIPAVHPEIPVRDNQIAILSQDGELLESVSIYDTAASKPEVFPLIERRPSKMSDAAGKRQWVDLFHTNSVEWMYQRNLFEKHPLYGPDNVLVCSRHQDRIAIIDMKKREWVWSWGRSELSGPHDAQVLANGNILLFDNGVAQKRSRVLEIDPVSGRIVWEFKAPHPRDFFSLRRGSAQRLPNGNTLIANADNGEIFEVTSDGDVVWRYLYPDTNAKGRRATIVHAWRYDPAFIDGLIERFEETHD